MGGIIEITSGPPVAQTFSGCQQQEEVQAASFPPETVGAPWSRHPRQSGSPEASRRAGEGACDNTDPTQCCLQGPRVSGQPVWEGPGLVLELMRG